MGTYPGLTNQNVSMFRPSLTRPQLIFAVALWLSVAANLTTLEQFFLAAMTPSTFERISFAFGGWLFVLVSLLAFLFACCFPFRGGRVRYPLIVALIVAAVLSHFTQTLGMHFDKTMLQNVLQTDAAEAADLVTVRLFLWLLVVGVVPSLLVWRVHLRETGSPWWRTAWQPAVAVLMLAAVCVGVVASQYARYASAVRNHRVSFHTIAPVNVVTAGLAWVAQYRNARVVRAAFGTDAKQKYALKQPRLVVFLLGETTRAQNVGLNGYARDTTPRMRALSGVYFPDTQSCGTSTAVSVPCIFSGMSRQNYAAGKARSQETLIDVIKRTGATVIWRDNDGGCKGVCDGAEFDDLNNARHPEWCPERGNCYDEVLLDGLEARLANASGDVFVVLHLKGSHGPAYYKRYPPSFERFTPACRSNDLAQCSEEEIVNAYDNTILYTDHVVGQTAAMLKRLDSKFATALLYVSDHGESLGEKGFYLHGLPYVMAPETQTKVPMFAWLSPKFIVLERWNSECVNSANRVPRSHDAVFHTLLGLMGISTSVYDRTLDVFSSCKSQVPRASG